MPEAEPAALKKKLGELKREAEERDAKRRAALAGLPYVDLRKVPISIEAIKLVPEEEARAAKAAAIELRVRELALTVFDPKAKGVQGVIKKLQAQKYEVKMFVASQSGLESAWRLYQFVSKAGGEITGKIEIEKKSFEELVRRLGSFRTVREELDKIDFKKVSTSELFKIILAGALSNRASDVHFEAEEEKAKVRFRLDGVLHDILSEMPLKNYDALLSRVKLLSGLKINIRSEPQDGRFTIELAQKEVEVRVSIIPSEFGETIVMRLLDPASIAVNLPDLGLRKDDLELVEREIKKPHGLILNTGPTGSGKTTTLYAFLRKINNPEIKIITIEDPIEYRIEGIEQTQVDPEAGYAFASGLRAIVRQDPDIILVGEIRDEETADIALQASLTGHLVFSTLHTNDAAGAVPRLVNLGVKPATIGPALSLAIAQRLVRVLCGCKKPRKVTAELKNRIDRFLSRLPKRVDRAPYEHYTVYEPKGCAACNDFGYRGRKGIFEFLTGGPELEGVILKEISETALKRLAERQGMVTMQEDGVLKVLSGITSFAEVEGATGPIQW